MYEKNIRDRDRFLVYSMTRKWREVEEFRRILSAPYLILSERIRPCEMGRIWSIYHRWDQRCIHYRPTGTISSSSNSQISETALKKDGCSTSGTKVRTDKDESSFIRLTLNKSCHLLELEDVKTKNRIVFVAIV